MRVDFEGLWVFGPGLADRLKGCSPLQRLEVLGEIVGRDEGEHVCREALEGLVMEDLHGGLFDRAVHALCLAVGPRMIGLGQPVLDGVLLAHTVEGMAPEACGRA